MHRWVSWVLVAVFCLEPMPVRAEDAAVPEDFESLLRRQDDESQEEIRFIQLDLIWAPVEGNDLRMPDYLGITVRMRPNEEKLQELCYAVPKLTELFLFKMFEEPLTPKKIQGGGMRDIAIDLQNIAYQKISKDALLGLEVFTGVVPVSPQTERLSNLCK